MYPTANPFYMSTDTRLEKSNIRFIGHGKVFSEHFMNRHSIGLAKGKGYNAMNRHSKPIFVVILVCCALLWTVLPVVAVSGQDNNKPTADLSSNVLNQIAAISKMKAARTKAQKRINSQILQALQKKKGEWPFDEGSITIGIDIPEDGILLVDITADVTPSLLKEIGDLGGEVVSHHAHYNAIRAKMPLDKIEQLAENDAIRNIRPADRAILNKVNTSEGDVAHEADVARAANGFDGTGIKIGVLSDSVDNLADVQTTGDLPDVTVLADAPGNSGEGTAMLEIVHDLAPGAGLYFATALNSMADFATNIIALADAGCDVIVDDIMYYFESPFQDDIISQAVNTVNERGVLYFSSAGNSGNLNDGESGVWEGDYNGIGYSLELPYPYVSVHDFQGGDALNTITGWYYIVTLQWSDPLAGSANDYDLIIIDPDGTTVRGYSDGVQDGDDDPLEGLTSSYNLTGYHLIVALYSGDQRFINLSTHRGRLEYGTDGQMRGHACAADAFGVAAVSANLRTTPFDGSESVEYFSSDGPRRVFYYPDGTPITPGNFLATGGTVREKPDVAAADGVATATPGFNPFYGTSAAAPHAAAIGALILDANDNLTIGQVQQTFEATSLDIEGSGWDRDSGFGIVMASSAIDYVCSTFGCGTAAVPVVPMMMLLLLSE